MKLKRLSVTALVALALGAASAEAAMPRANIGPAIGTEASRDQSIEPVHYRYTYREFWRGNCLYRTVYITDGYRWRYRWRRRCYGRYTE